MSVRKSGKVRPANAKGTKRKPSHTKRKPSQMSSCVTVEAHNHIVELGTTRISDLYGSTHGRSLIAVLDAGLRTIYVAEDAANRLRKLFHARKAKGDFWAISSATGEGKYRVKPIHELDIDRPVRTTDVIAISGWECVVYKKGTCIDFFYNDGRFAYSWKATEDTGLCTRGGRDCKEIVQNNQVTLFPGKGCTGRGIPQNKDWMFCIPG